MIVKFWASAANYVINASMSLNTHCVMEKINAIKGTRITILPWKSKKLHLLTCKVNKIVFWLCTAELVYDSRHTLAAGDRDIKSNVLP